MSLQKLGKKDSPPVTVNGEPVSTAVTKVNIQKNPPPGFDLTKLTPGMGKTVEQIDADSKPTS